MSLEARSSEFHWFQGWGEAVSGFGFQVSGGHNGFWFWVLGFWFQGAPLKPETLFS
jgi:hypothetical protein